MPASFAVLGAGAFGTAIALHLARDGRADVALWGARPEAVETIRRDRENKRYLPGVPLPPNLRITADPAEAVAGAQLWVSGIPTVHLRNTLARFRPFAGPPVVSLTKGIELATFRRPSQVIAEALGIDQVVALSGPSHAEEVARGMPTSVVAAGDDESLTAQVQAWFNSDRFRVYTNPDLVGVEVAGALKNVVALGAGICDGLGFGDNAKSALLTRGLVEMTRFGMAVGAQHDTFQGLAGIGDLITTCFSPHGRNRRVGERLAKGEPAADVLAGPQVAEGVNTARSVHQRVAATGLDMPICEGVYHVLYDGQSPADEVQRLLARGQRGENTFLG